MSNQDLLFNELNANESDAIKGGTSGVVKKYSYKDSYNKYKDSFNTTNNQSINVGGDLAVANGSNIGANSPINIGNFG